MEAIHTELTILTGDLDRTKQRNIELDTILNDTRRQRDEAEQTLSTVKADRAQIEHDLVNARQGLDSVKAELDQTKTYVQSLIKERDDYGLQAMSAEDRATQAEAKLAKLAEALGLPQPETKPEPPKQPESAPPTTPYPQAEQAIPSSPKRVYEGDYGYNDLNYHTEQFDYEQKRHYRTA
jgi:chromosome segregation ATPase